MHANIRRTTLCFVIKDHEILLVERKDTWYENNKYLPPGGNVDHGEDPKTACTRELFEETGLNVDTETLQLIWQYRNHFNNQEWDNYYYLARDYSGTIENRELNRHASIGWFNLKDLPENTSQVVYDTLKRI